MEPVFLTQGEEMRLRAETDKRWKDPLSRNYLKVNDRITVQSPNVVTDFIILKINDDDSITIGPPSIQKEKKDTIVASLFLPVGSKNLKINELVTVTNEKGVSQKMKVDYVINNKILILSPHGQKQKLGLFDKLKFLWSA